MKDYKLQTIAAFLICIGLSLLLGLAGDFDFCDQVILSMSQEEYDYVKEKLVQEQGNNNPSEREIAHWWADHHYKMR